MNCYCEIHERIDPVTHNFPSSIKATRPMSDGFGDPWENLNHRVRFSFINKSHPTNVGWRW